MAKIKKDYNLKIVSLLAVITFLLNSTAYGIDLYNTTHLRVPINKNTSTRMNATMLHDVELLAIGQIPGDTDEGRLDSLYDYLTRNLLPKLKQKGRKLTIVNFGIGEHGSPTTFDLAKMVGKAGFSDIVIYGVDNNIEFIKQAERRAKKESLEKGIKVVFKKGDFALEEIGLNNVDIIIVSNVMMYYPNDSRDKYLRLMSQVLRDGGKIIVSTGPDGQEIAISVYLKAGEDLEKPIRTNILAVNSRKDSQNIVSDSSDNLRDSAKYNVKSIFLRWKIKSKIKKLYSPYVLKVIKKYGGKIIGIGSVENVLIIRTQLLSGEIKAFTIRKGKDHIAEKQKTFYNLTPDNVPRVYYSEEGMNEPIEISIMDGIEDESLYEKMQGSGAPGNLQDLKDVIYKTGRLSAAWHKDGLSHNEFDLEHIRLRGNVPVVTGYDFASSNTELLSPRADIDFLFTSLEMFVYSYGEEGIRELKDAFLIGYREVFANEAVERFIFDREVYGVAVVQKKPGLSATIMPQVFARDGSLANIIEGANKTLELHNIPARIIRFAGRKGETIVKLVDMPASNVRVFEECL